MLYSVSLCMIAEDDVSQCLFSFLFFFNAPATTEIYTLSLHDALPIWRRPDPRSTSSDRQTRASFARRITSISWAASPRDRKSTRLNSSHGYISYAVFCLKKKTSKQTLHSSSVLNGERICYCEKPTQTQ